MDVRNLVLAAALLAMGIGTATAQDATEPDAPATESEPAAEPSPEPAPEPAASSDPLIPVAADEAPAADEALAVIPVAAEQPEALPADPESTQLDAMEVTASYRKQNIQDVVGGAHVFGGRDLDRAGVTGMEDYLNQVPSVSLQKSGAGTNKIAMRGISNVNESDLGYADGSSTTGVYLNDVAIQGSGVFPDLNIYDLSRIEVLKGPQGTLYGEGSMGGAVKMITRPAEANAFDVRGNIARSLTEQGDPSWDGRLAVNLPTGVDTLGVRLVGSLRETGGFVDYTSLDRVNADDEEAHSVRGIATWGVTDALELELMHLSDYSHAYQFPTVNEGKQEELTNSNLEDQYNITDFTIDALTARYNLSFGMLTSVTALYDTDRDLRRRTPVLQTLLQAQYTDAGLGQAPNTFNNATTRVVTALQSMSQELRLVSFGGEQFNWILGAFYRDRNQTFDQEKREDEVSAGGNPFLGGFGAFVPVAGRQEQGFGDETFTQMAGYGELQWVLIPDTLEITGGLRYFTEEIGFFIDTTFYGAEAFLFATDPDKIQPDGTAKVYFEQSLKTDGILPKLAVSWHLDTDHMVYASLTRGFRSGTANIYAALESGPPVVRPDYVWNSEVGAKSTWFDGALITNLSGYRLDWEDMQGTVLGTAQLGAAEIPFAHLDNAGDAVLLGAEGSIAWLPSERLSLQVGAGWNEGEVTRSNEGTSVREGGTLPNTPKITWSTTAAYTQPLWWGLESQLSVTYSWIDEQNVIFEPAPQQDQQGNTIDYTTRTTIDGYSQLKGTFGVQRGEWRAQIFGDNLLDERAVVAIAAPTAEYTVLPPRVLGLRVSYDF